LAAVHPARTGRISLVVLLGGTLLVGCGSSPSSDLSASAATVLQKDAAALAAAATSGNGSAVQAAVATLRADVGAQRAHNGLSAARAARVLAAAAKVAADVPAPVPTPVVTPVTPKSEAPAPGKAKKRKHYQQDQGGNNQD
jgi:hypothetical protein